MNNEKIFEELKDICRRLNIKIIYEVSGHLPGYAVVNKKQFIVLNRLASLEDKIHQLSNALKDVNLDGIFIKPIIRNYIDKGNPLF